MKKILSVLLAGIILSMSVSAFADNTPPVVAGEATMFDSDAPEQTENISTDVEKQTEVTEQRTLAVYALDSSKAYVNGQYIDTEIPYMYKGVTMMPVETLVPLLGGSTSYDVPTRTLTLFLNGKQISFSIDDEKCRLFKTAFYQVRPICDALGIKLEWYNGLISMSTDSPQLTEDEINAYKTLLDFNGFEDISVKEERLEPTWFVNPYVPYTYDQMNSDLHTLRKMYPDLFSEVYSIGYSEEGREISAINFGKGDTEVIVCGSMHAREYIATTYIMYYLDRYAYSYYINQIIEDKYNVRDILDNVTFIVVPQLNPDGINLVQHGVESTKNPDAVRNIRITSDGGEYGYRGWKSNTNGVNLNANFPVLWVPNGDTPNSSSYGGPEGGSESETRAMVNLIDNTDFEILASFHTQGQVIYWMDGNCDRDLVAKHRPYVDRICNEIGFTRMPPDSTTGIGRCLTDYARYYKRAMAMTIELCPYVGNYPYPDEQFDTIAWPARNLGLMLGNIALELAGKR